MKFQDVIDVPHESVRGVTQRSDNPTFQTTSEPFKTKMGVPQGDCLSPILFTLYLAKALDKHPQGEDHQYARPSTEDRNIPKQGTLIRPKYSDDIGWAAANSKERMEAEKTETLPKLTNRGLRINETKTETFTISRESNNDWKKCKILGSLLDTTEDIKRRKQLANNAMRKLEHIFTNKKLATQLKIRVFRACIESIFLYNAELWTVNKNTENKINSFHRRLLRKAIDVKWPRKMTSDNLYTITKQQKWSDTIRTRRLRWYGHVERLHEETPAKQALAEARRKVRKPRGGQTSTWLKVLEKDLKGLNITTKEAEKIAKDRKEWKKTVWRSRAPRVIDT